MTHRGSECSNIATPNALQPNNFLDTSVTPHNVLDTDTRKVTGQDKQKSKKKHLMMTTAV
ncbi:hypothetical protein OUZ56_028412 [Daphnia magna]|uniref:Uncharacterized protein n=1 Tax=Daphnia magna TaxID=35525 RepID=A0ABR0B3T6_9CRUS|nr:hypothetical protein OUZ56_028412 [Daphnia magna]